MYLTPMITAGQVAAAVDAFFRGIRFADVRAAQEKEDERLEMEREWAEHEAHMQALRMAVGGRLHRLGDWMHQQNAPVEEEPVVEENDMVAYLRAQNEKLSAQVDALTAQIATLIATLGTKESQA